MQRRILTIKHTSHTEKHTEAGSSASGKPASPSRVSPALLHFRKPLRQRPKTVGAAHRHQKSQEGESLHGMECVTALLEAVGHAWRSSETPSASIRPSPLVQAQSEIDGGHSHLP